jgi:hypothetical protein
MLLAGCDVRASVDLFPDPAPLTKKVLLIFMEPDSDNAVGKVECDDEAAKDEEDEQEACLQQRGEHHLPCNDEEQEDAQEEAESVMGEQRSRQRRRNSRSRQRSWT